MEIIPAIDIIDSKCVRLTEGDYAQKTVYNESPPEVARMFEDAGLKRLHLVDLDGAKAGKVVNWKVLESITSTTSLTVDFGGGVKSEEDVKKILDSGASYVTIGSMAVKNEELLTSWLKQYGPDKFLIGADVKGYRIAIHGWTETTEVNLFDFIEKYMGYGIRQIFCTDVSKDGKLAGPSTELYTDIIKRFPELFFIASGGVSSLDDLKELEAIGCSGAIVGKAIYENRIRLDELVGKK